MTAAQLRTFLSTVPGDADVFIQLDTAKDHLAGGDVEVCLARVGGASFVVISASVIEPAIVDAVGGAN